MALTSIDYAAGQDLNSDVFDKINAIITAVNELQAGSANQIFKKTSGTDFAFEACNSFLPTSSTGNLLVSSINIGDWNMDTTSSITVAHGIGDYTKIIGVFAVIRNDADTNLVSLQKYNPTTGVSGGGFEEIDATNITLSRVASGFFDSSSYNSTSYNRGFLTIIYKE
jgi:hypothetical protein